MWEPDLHMIRKDLSSFDISRTFSEHVFTEEIRGVCMVLIYKEIMFLILCLQKLF
jgi:hypothetical protein